MREPHAAAPVFTSLTQQVRLLAMSGRIMYAALAFTGLFIVIERPVETSLVVAAVVALAAAAVWPVIVWLGEPPSRRAYHWSLPVERRTHDLMRVIAGAVSLMLMCALLAAAGAVSDLSVENFSNAPQAWAGFFLAPLTIYLLVMPIALWSDYTITRWALAGSVAYGFVALLFESQGIDLFTRGIEAIFIVGPWNVATTMTDGAKALIPAHDMTTGTWFAAITFWFSVGAFATAFTLAFRPDDLRRAFLSLSAARRPVSS